GLLGEDILARPCFVVIQFFRVTDTRLVPCEECGTQFRGDGAKGIIRNGRADVQWQGCRSRDRCDAGDDGLDLVGPRADWPAVDQGYDLAGGSSGAKPVLTHGGGLPWAK